MKKVPKNIALNINLSPPSHPGTSVFAYRGPDIDKNIWEAMKDIESDIAIASSGNVFVQDGLNQFHDAYTFYTETIKKVGGGAHVGTKSFTGHSLGGRLDGLGHFLNISA